MNDIYGTFVDEYLNPTREQNIVSFDTFVDEFINFYKNIAKLFPITKTGFISSSRCSSGVSGLSVEIQNGGDMKSSADKQKWIRDINFDFYRTTAKKFGFMVDMNAPWRLVWNIKSRGYDINNRVSSGALKYMINYGVDHNNLFDIYYDFTYEKDLNLLKSYFYFFYDSFCTQRPYIYKKIFVKNNNVAQNCSTKIKFKKIFRPRFIFKDRRQLRKPEQLPASYLESHSDGYWLNVYLLFRNLETDSQWTSEAFHRKKVEMMRQMTDFDLQSALKYVNVETRGYKDIGFNSRGKYWQGNRKSHYDTTIRKSKNKIFEGEQL